MIKSADHNLPALSLPFQINVQPDEKPNVQPPLVVPPPTKPKVNFAEIGVITNDAYDKSKNLFSIYANKFNISQTEHNSVLTKTMLAPKYDF